MTTSALRIGLRTAITLIAVAVSACTQFTVRADKNPDTDFTRYRTFAWMPIAAAPPRDQDTGSRGIDKRIYSAVEGELQRRGYAPESNATADLLVTFRLLKTDGYDDAHISYTAQWHRHAYREALHAKGDSYDRGTLLVDVVARADKALVWRGSASARLLPHRSYDERVARAEAAVAKILETFPAR